MKYSLRIARIGGIDIGVHYTWIFIFVLITWSLAQGYFPQAYKGWDTATYWITGIIAAILLFVSVLIHELSHSFMARSKGMTVSSITLFLFGGVSNLEDEPKKPGEEFAMAIVGPLSSFVLAGIFWGLAAVVQNQQSPLSAILIYMALINAILAVFNLLPGFPLDGGRVLRSILWASTRSLNKATNIAATVGRLFGWILIAFGIFQLFAGNFFGGIWIAFIGWFLSSAAESSRREITIRDRLTNIKVRELVNTNSMSISPDVTVAELVSSIFRGHYSRAVPVCQGAQVLGIVTVTDIKDLPQDKWVETHVKDIMTRQPLYEVSLDDDLNTALRVITQHDINQVLVLQDGKCAGLLSRADILRHLQLSQELGIKAKQ